jgi:sarcosine oxidase
MGAAALYQLAKRGADVLGIDSHAPPHGFGSSHGETRITRRAVGEGDAYAPLALRSHAIWCELEAITGTTLLHQVGCLIMAPRGSRMGHHHKVDFLGRTIAVARDHGIAHETLDAASITARFPGFVLSGNEEGCFEPGGGYVRPERCIAAQLTVAKAHGARIRTGTTARNIRQRNGVVSVETDAGIVEAPQVVVAAGAWAGPLLGTPFDRLLRPYRQVLHWFPLDAGAREAAAALPTFIWMYGTTPAEHCYGFPAIDGAAEIKVATEQYTETCDPDRVERNVVAGDIEGFGNHVASRLRGTASQPLRSSVCLYTVTPDGNFVIDRHPAMDRVLVVSACSGHGFKHSAGIGEAVAQLLDVGDTTASLKSFRLDRFHA